MMCGHDPGLFSCLHEGDLLREPMDLTGFIGLVHSGLLAGRRETDQVVEEHFQENGQYKPIKFDEKYAKRFGVQYLVGHRKTTLCLFYIHSMSCFHAAQHAPCK